MNKALLRAAVSSQNCKVCAAAEMIIKSDEDPGLGGESTSLRNGAFREVLEGPEGGEIRTS